jgi:hypothetical protein
MITTQKEVRQLFWEYYPEFKSEYRTKKRQNEYRTDIRCAFVSFIDSLYKNGTINEKLSNNVTL